MITLIIPVTDKRGEKNKKHLDDLLTCVQFGGYEKVTILALYDATTLEFVEYFQEKYPFLKAIYNTGNPLKFTRNVNVGLRWVLQNQPENHVIIVNQDCILPGWNYLSQLEGEGISTPDSIELPGGLNDLEKLDLAQPDETIRTRLNKNVPFFCPFINNAVIKKIGLLDPAFKVTFSDEDYCLRAILAGFPIENVNIKISHLGTHIDTSPGWESGSGSYNAEIIGMELRQYLTKWQIPVSHEESFSWLLDNFQWSKEMKIN